MAKEAKGKPITHQTAVMLAVIIVLAGGFVYDYASMSSQIASMSSQISTLCLQGSSIAYSEGVLIANVTVILNNQIQTDNSLIQTLNSTRPAGYTGVIAALKNETAQDSALITYFQHVLSPYTTTLLPPNYPCS